MNVVSFTKTGTKAATLAKLEESVFGVKTENHELLKVAYLAYLANARTSLAKTKERGDVRGGGKKPWRQKSTGRARFGSIRNPIWRGGGVVFGPTGNENYKLNLSTAAKRQAIRQALSLKTGSIKVIEALNVQAGKVKPVVNLLTKIGAKRNVLLVVEDKNLLVERSTRNLPEIKAVQATYVNVYDVMNADNIVITKKALEIIHEWLGDKK